MLKPFFPYPGSKFRLNKLYPPPEQKSLVEPFAGSACYACRYPDRKVMLYDINPVICGVWDYLIKENPKQILKIKTNFDSVEELKIPQEGKWLVGYWLQRGSPSPAKVPHAWMRSGIYKTSFWSEAKRERISQQMQFIRHWKIKLKSFEMIQNSRSTWFIDPPYHRSGIKTYHYSQINYKDLASFVRSRNGLRIVCEQDGADWLRFSALAIHSGITLKKNLELVHISRRSK